MAASTAAEAEEERIEEAFELGSTALALNLLVDHEICDLHTVHLKYCTYQNLALALNIELADIPSENTAGSAMREFLSAQEKIVQKQLVKHKSQRFPLAFLVGYESLALITMIGMRNSARGEEHTKSAELVTEKANKLKRVAEGMQIDLNAEVNKMVDDKDFSRDSDSGNCIKLLENLKTKVCKRERVNRKRSEIDPSRFISDEDWAVSLVRLPGKGNPEHAFLVLEGKEGNKSMIWFADFVTNDPNDQYRPGKNDGKVRIDYHDSEALAGTNNKLLFQCTRNMMKIHYGDHLQNSTWSIAKNTAETLINNIEAKKGKPPKYSIVGDTAIGYSTDAAKSNESTSHNCYTFLRMMLNDLNDEGIQIPQTTLEAWVGIATILKLPDKWVRNVSWTALIWAFLTGALVAWVVLKLL